MTVLGHDAEVRLCSTTAIALVTSLLLSSCSVMVVRTSARHHRRPNAVAYAAPALESAVAVAATIFTVIVARAEADDPRECMVGFLGGEPTCTSRYGGASLLGATAVVAAGFALYGWLKIHAIRNPPDGCPDDDFTSEHVVGCPAPSWALVRDAHAAAKAGDCASVNAIAAELRTRGNGAIGNSAFLNDAAIQDCVLGMSHR